jgi:TPR repeat protein
VQSALKQADAGDLAPLVKQADAGDTEAQYYAGVMFIFGRGQIAKDPKRGCAYEEKASMVRADAAHLVGLCHQSGGFGAPDKAKAEAAYLRAIEMGFSKAKCALGQMLMADPSSVQRGLGLCQEAATAGDADAAMTVADAYFNGAAVTRDHKAARKWYEVAARLNNQNANRKLGEMYARGDGGRKDVKKAMERWTTAEKAGDPLVSILVADQLFFDLTGGAKPGPGKFAFRGGIPVADIQVAKEWYQQAYDQDPRADVKQRAKSALSVLESFERAATSVSVQTNAR